MIYVLLVLLWVLAAFGLAHSARVKENTEVKIWIRRVMIVVAVVCLLLKVGSISTAHECSMNETALNEVEKSLDKTDFLLYAVNALHNTNNNKEDLELVVDRTKEILYKISSEQKAELQELKSKNLDLSKTYMILTGRPIEE